MPTACLKPVCAVFNHLRNVAVKGRLVLARSILSYQIFFVFCKCFGHWRRERKTFSPEPKIVQTVQILFNTLSLVMNSSAIQRAHCKKHPVGAAGDADCGRFRACSKEMVSFWGSACLRNALLLLLDLEMPDWRGWWLVTEIGAFACGEGPPAYFKHFLHFSSVLSAHILVCLGIVEKKLSVFVAWQC